MKIKDVEMITGITSQNIRFYEKKGLIAPGRNKYNTYREYGEEEIRRLRIVKMLRMLDMPIDEIAMILNGQKELSEALREQRMLLERRMSEMRSAIELCEQLRRANATVQTLDVNEYLTRMEKDKSSFFSKWISDYKEVVQYEHERVFTFMPDEPITDRYEFANALYAFAMEKDLDIVITKETMYPEFTLNGVKYRAERNYSRGGKIPVAVVTCTRVDPPEAEEKFRHGRKKWQRFLHISWPGLLLIAYILLTRWNDEFAELFHTWEGWVMLGAVVVVCAVGAIRNYYLYWNRDFEYEDKSKGKSKKSGKGKET